MIAHDDRRVVGWSAAVLVLIGAALGGIFGGALWFAPVIAAIWRSQ